jgi:hypothetical protein
VFASRVYQQARLRLTAAAAIGVIVITHPELIDRQLRLQSRVQGFHLCARLCAARHIRLIGHHDQIKACRLQQPEPHLNSGQNL